MRLIILPHLRQQVSLFAPEGGQVVGIDLTQPSHHLYVNHHHQKFTNTNNHIISIQVKSELCHTGQRFLKIREVIQLFIALRTF